MRINFDTIIDYMMEKDGEYAEYRRLCEVYKKNHRISYIDMTLHTQETERIRMHQNFFDRSDAALDAVLAVLEFDTEQEKRLYDIYRAVKKWYEKTEWQRNLPEELVERIEAYVVG